MNHNMVISETFILESAKMWVRLVHLAIVSVVLSAHPLFAAAKTQQADAAKLTNIAFGKQYEFSKKPSYSLCTDDGDKTDLTDGKRSTKSYWTEKGTVGWQHPRGTVAITIDLGKVEPIQGAALGTGGGGAGVTYPHSIVVSVSDDNKKFTVVGDLVRLSTEELPAPGYGESDERGAAHTYHTESLQTRGRYVRFDIVPSGAFFFTDEVEIYRGTDNIKSTTGPSLTPEFVTDKTRLTQIGCYRRIRRDTELLRKAVNASKLAPQARAAAIQELNAITASNEQQLYPASEAGFRASIPLNSLHARVYAVYTKLLSSQGLKPLNIWHTHPYQLLTPWDVPQGELTKLNIEMMLKERRAEVINITNTSSQAKEIRINSSSLPFVRIRQVEWLDSREGRIVGSAILPIERRGNTSVVRVPAGMTRQLWLSFDPKDVQPGKQTGHITLESGDFVHQVDISVDVAPFQFPEKPRLSLGTWDYIFDKNYGITEQNQAEAKAILLDGLVNTVWCGPGTAPVPTRSNFDKDGNLKSEPDYSKWDAWVRMFPEAAIYSAFVAWHSHTSRYLGFDRKTPEFKRAMAQWGQAWAQT